MANVGFKRGSQATLDSLIGQGTGAGGLDGVFYLTNDTNRLYIGKEDGSIVAVNEGVITAPNIQSLPTPSDDIGKKAITGRFYYVTEGNILCVYNGHTWIQINSYTNTTITDVTNSVEVVDDSATITTTIKDSNNATKDSTFNIKVAGGLTIASTGISTDPEITISGEAITFSADVATGSKDLTLNLGSDSGTTNDSVTIKAGTNVEFSKDSDGSITLNTTGVKDLILNDKASNTKIDPEDKTTGYEFTIKDNQSRDIASVLFNPDIIYGVGKVDDATTSTKIAHFKNNQLKLDIYTKDEIDMMQRAFNAMEYRGTIGDPDGTAGTTVPTINQKNGYTYILSNPTTVVTKEYPQGKVYPAGTMIIATGTENDQGYLSAPIIWAAVEGSAADTTYKFDAIPGGVALKSSTNDSSSTFAVVAGKDITIASSAESGKTQTVTVNHKEYTTSTEDGTKSDLSTSATTFTAVTGLTTENGHITEIETTDFSVNGLITTVKDFNTSVNATSTAQVNIKDSITLEYGNKATSQEKTSTYAIKSESLTLGASGNAINIDMTWGTF